MTGFSRSLKYDIIRTLIWTKRTPRCPDLSESGNHKVIRTFFQIFMSVSCPDWSSLKYWGKNSGIYNWTSLNFWKLILH